MKNKMYLYTYLIFLVLFCTNSYTIFASSEIKSSEKESTTTQTTTPEKKETKRKLSAKQEKKKLKKEQKEKNRCPYHRSPLKNLKSNQLEEVYEYTKTHTMDNAFIIDLLNRLIALSDNHIEVKKYKLQLADLHYSLHHIEKAAACYEDFAALYPGSQEAEYVLYKAILCMFEISLDAERDQSNTNKTIALIKEFLKSAKNPELIKETHEILQNCYYRLYDQEVYVFNFYRKKKNFTAAELRIEYIRKTFETMIPELTEKVEILLQQLEYTKNPPPGAFWNSIMPEEGFKDNGPVDTKKNRAAKFLA